MNATRVRPAYTARPGEAILVFRDPGRSFAIGRGRLTIQPADARFLNSVVKDLSRLVHSQAGEAALNEGDALGRTVSILRPDLPTAPSNAWIVPDDLAAACAAGVVLGRGQAGARYGAGGGCGSTIVYDPADWPVAGDPHSPSSAAVLLLLLRQANLNARGESDPSQPDWGAGETET